MYRNYSIQAVYSISIGTVQSSVLSEMLADQYYSMTSVFLQLSSVVGLQMDKQGYHTVQCTVVC